MRVSDANRSVVGSTNPVVAEMCYNLAMIAAELGDMKEARAQIQRTYDIATQCLGLDHPLTQEAAEKLVALKGVS